jgi:hypothetical protein
MTEEFQNIGVNAVESTSGFTVEIHFTKGVIYADPQGQAVVPYEWLVNPFRILLYHPKGSLPPERVSAVLSNATKALEFMGHRIELWES